MNYLDETILELKEKIMLCYQHLKSATTEDEVKRQTAEVEEALREKLVESFKNGLEAGKKQKRNFERRK